MELLWEIYFPQLLEDSTTCVTLRHSSRVDSRAPSGRGPGGYRTGHVTTKNRQGLNIGKFVFRVVIPFIKGLKTFSKIVNILDSSSNTPGGLNIGHSDRTLHLRQNIRTRELGTPHGVTPFNHSLDLTTFGSTTVS